MEIAALEEQDLVSARPGGGGGGCYQHQEMSQSPVFLGNELIPGVDLSRTARGRDVPHSPDTPSILSYSSRYKCVVAKGCT